MNSALERNLLWVLGGLVATFATAWIAFQIQQEQVAPVLLFPLSAGAVLGGVLAALARAVSPSPALAIVSAIVGGLLLVATQDYIGHRQRLELLEGEIARSHPLAMALASDREMRPSFVEHVQSRWRAEPIWWPLDFALTAASAGAVVFFGIRPNSTAEPSATK